MNEKVLKLLIENKRNSNSFNTALRTGNKENLDKYFQLAKENNINLFDYHIITGHNSSVIVMEMLSKLIKKEQKERNLDEFFLDEDEEINSKIKEWFIYFQNNGLNLFQRSLKNIDGTDEDNHKYPYLRTIENKEIKYNDIIKEIILKNQNKENYLTIKNDDEFIRILSEERINSEEFINIFIKMRESNCFEENILLINPKSLMMLYNKYSNKKNYYENIFEDYNKNLKNNNINQTMKDHFQYILEHENKSDFIMEFMSKTDIKFEDLYNLVFPEDKFNIKIEELKKIKDELKWTWKYNPLTFEFLANDMSLYCLNQYFEKLVYFNNNSAGNNKLKFSPELLSSDSYLRILYTLIKKEKFARTINVDLEKVNYLIKELNIKTEEKYVYKMFNYIENLYNPGKALDSDEFSFILKNFVPLEDVNNEIEDIKSYYIRDKFKNKKHFDEKNATLSKIIIFLEWINEIDSYNFIKDLPYKKKMEILSSSEKMTKNLSEKEIMELFNIEKISNYFFKYGNSFNEYYSEEFVKKGKNILIFYAKGLNCDIENINEKIDDLLKILVKNIKDKKNENLPLKIEFEKFFIGLSILPTDKTASVRKRL